MIRKLGDSGRQDKEAIRYALLAGPARGLGLLKRVPELLRQRGWPHEGDLAVVCAAAVGCTKIGAGRQLLRRPREADGCGGRWPADAGTLTARQIVEELELSDLLVPR